MRLSKYFGPSTIIAAAFIGPGTLTVCSIAGYKYGYDLLWVLLFSIMATLVLQEMSARLGWKTQQGLAEAVHRQLDSGLLKYLFIIIIVSAIIVGNAAYEAGNISGGSLGLEALIGSSYYLPLIMGLIAFVLLFIGSQKWLEYFLIGLVLLMSSCFLLTAVLLTPSLLSILQGFVPKFLDSGQLLIALALVGTTVVPYNLFLHASTISKKYKKNSDIKDIRRENNVAIMLGGFISILIVIVSATTRQHLSDGQEIKSANDLAIQLTPLLGSYSSIMVSIGLLAAGLSSAITAPLAAAFAAKGIFRWSDDEKDWKFRTVWIFILLIGIIVSSVGINAIVVIRFAQIANGILLPVIAIFLLWVMNNAKLMGKYKNTNLNNILGIVVIGITVLIAFKAFDAVFKIIS